MHLAGILRALDADPSVSAAVAAAAHGPYPVTVEVRDALKSALVQLIAGRTSRPVILITTDDAKARELAHDLRAWARVRRALHFPDPDQPAYSMLAIGHDVLAQRVAVLAELMKASATPTDGAPVIVASLPALMRRLLPVADFRTHFLSLTPGARADLDNDVVADRAQDVRP